MPTVNYIYNAKLERVIDGDTAVLLIDLGFNASTTQHVRFQGYNAPELHGMHASNAQAAKDELQSLLEGNPLVIVTTKNFLKTFARYVADVYVVVQKDFIRVSEHMISKGFNVEQGK